MVELAAASLGDICEVGAVGEFCQGVIIYTVGSSTGPRGEHLPSLLKTYRSGQGRAGKGLGCRVLDGIIKHLY